MGEDGSPSIWTTLPSVTNTCCPQPAAQRGHAEETTRSAVSVRGLIRSVRADMAARPRPDGSDPVSCR